MMYYVCKELLVLVLIFLVSVLVGIVLVVNDDNFVCLILGNGYVDMIFDNIVCGELMVVYNGLEEVFMFLGIILNNIMVFFNVFVMGLFISFGIGWLLFNNGVMFGVFQIFFFKYGLLGEFMFVIWLYGILEIWVIIVVGVVGLVLGNGWLFFGIYFCKEFFMRGVKKGLKIIVGIVFIFIMVGFIEGFIMCYIELFDVLWLGIILLLLLFIIYYYIYLLNRKIYGIIKI